MVLFGGQSEEHEVSLMSCTSVLNYIDAGKYNVYCVGITKKGQWRLFDADYELISKGLWEDHSKPIAFPGDPSFGGFFMLEDPSKIYRVDVAFPVMHGPHAEDGTLQGLFELANVPYVGCQVTSSALCMDKWFTKEIFKINDIPCCDYMLVLRDEVTNNPQVTIGKIKKKFKFPVFVKPANLGSSVGISKAKDDESLLKALIEAGKHDRKILVEEFIDCREIECSVLGNDDPIASLPGEITPSNEFYDYNAKYIDGRSELIIPARVDQCKTDEIKALAIKAYKALDCSGMARVDFFLEKGTERIFVSEINTIPGFTSISMYPKLFEASGITYGDLIENLISLAFERSEKGD
jgi:D-alanine-D-alanine ligase